MNMRKCGIKSLFASFFVLIVLIFLVFVIILTLRLSGNAKIDKRAYENDKNY